jgi:hypothetical protein
MSRPLANYLKDGPPGLRVVTGVVFTVGLDPLERLVVVDIGGARAQVYVPDSLGPLPEPGTVLWMIDGNGALWPFAYTGI